MSAPSTADLGYRTQNPATGEVEKQFDTATDEQIQQALEKSQKAYQEWSKRPMSERAAIVKKVASLFTERRKELAQLAAREMGKPANEGSGEARFCDAIFSYYADNGEELTKDQVVKDIDGQKAVIERLPIGPLLGIMPWNYPYYQVARFAAPTWSWATPSSSSTLRSARSRPWPSSRSWTTPECPRACTRTSSPPTTRSPRSSPTRASRASR